MTSFPPVPDSILHYSVHMTPRAPGYITQLTQQQATPSRFMELHLHHRPALTSSKSGIKDHEEDSSLGCELGRLSSHLAPSFLPTHPLPFFLSLCILRAPTSPVTCFSQGTVLLAYLPSQFHLRFCSWTTSSGQSL